MPTLSLTDLRHAVRALKHNPAPVLVSTLSLSLGIAASATMVSVVDAIDFRPLPYADADRIVELAQATTAGATYASPTLLRAWAERTRSYETLGAASPIYVAIGNDERMIRAARANGEFFRTLDVAPVVGRTFTAAEVREGVQALVISYDVWQSRFNGDPNVLGQTVPISWAGEYRSVSAERFTVIGVLPRGAQYPRGSQVWLPATERFGGSLTVVARLRPNMTLAGARAELDVIHRQLAAEDPDTFEGRMGAVNPLRDAIRIAAGQRGASARFLLLFVTLFVLALAIMNAAIVFLVRAARQEHDLLIRAALGAPRSRLVTLMLAQSLIVALVAGAGGVILSVWGIGLADARLSVAASGLAPVLDWRVIAAGLTLSLVAGLIVGLVPALEIRHSNIQHGLRSRTAAGAGGAGDGFRRALVIGQVACALVLLSGAGTLTRDFVQLMGRDLGFDPHQLLIAAPPLGVTNAEAAEAANRITNLPGITGAALGGLPAVGYTYHLENGDSLTGAERGYSYRVSADYFRILGVPLLTGRAFVPGDRGGSAPVAIVNQTAARTWWPGQEAVGKRLYMESSAGGEWVTIVGMAGDEQVNRDPKDAIRPTLYRPWGQLASEPRQHVIYARAAREPESLIPTVRAVVRELRSGEGWQGDRVNTMTAWLGNMLDLQRFRSSALGLFSLFGLVLASMGIYGVVATVVNQRTAEIGIRVALGARKGDVLALVARGGIGLAAVGIVVGLAGAFGAHRVLASLVLSGGGFDVVGTLGAATLLGAVIVVACYVPGRRAARIDPTRALRESG